MRTWWSVLPGSAWSSTPRRPAWSSSGGSPPITGRRRGLSRPRRSRFSASRTCAGRPGRDGSALRRKTIVKRMRGEAERGERLAPATPSLAHPRAGTVAGRVVRGHTAYYAVPGNIAAVSAFREQVTRHWDRALRRRSQRHRVTWERMGRLKHGGSLPSASRVPGRTSDSTPVPKVGAQCASSARWDLCGGPPARAVPYRECIDLDVRAKFNSTRCHGT